MSRCLSTLVTLISNKYSLGNMKKDFKAIAHFRLILP
jgi:hypothetical protein